MCTHSMSLTALQHLASFRRVMGARRLETNIRDVQSHGGCRCRAKWAFKLPFGKFTLRRRGEAVALAGRATSRQSDAAETTKILENKCCFFFSCCYNDEAQQKSSRFQAEVFRPYWSRPSLAATLEASH